MTPRIPVAEPSGYTHQGQHLQGCVPCHTSWRRTLIIERATEHPEGLTPYQYTKGMCKADALQFWVDAKALGMVGAGHNQRGTKLFAVPAEVCS